MLTKKQHEIRLTGIGASEVAALAGLSRWSTPIAIWEAKVAGVVKDQTLAMELGDLIEAPIARLYAKRAERFVLKSDTLRHPKRELALATPDRLVFAERVKKDEPDLLARAEKLLQIKHSNWRQKSEWGRAGTDEIAEEYMPQVQWEMGVTGKAACDVAVLFDKDDFRVYTVPFDGALFEGLYEIAERFWVDHVLTKTPPPPDASAQYGAFLSRAYPAHRGEVMLDTTPEIEDLVFQLRDVRDEAKHLEGRETELVNRLKAIIGDKLGIVGEWGKITWKANKDSTKIDWEEAFKALADRMRIPPEEINGIVATFTTTKPGARPFLPKFK